MKSLLALLTFAPLLVLGEESYFFKYPKGGPKREIRIEDSKLHAITPIEKMPPLKAASIYASHAGLGKGREYQIQIDLVDKPEGNGVPMVKLGDEVITGGIYMSMSPGEESAASYHLESDDPEQIKRWCSLLADLLMLPQDRMEIDLTKAEEEDEEAEPERADQPGRLEGEAKWRLGSSGTLSLKMEGDATVFLLDGEREIYRLKGPEYIDEARPSDDGNSLALVVMKSEGGGGDYATLLKVHAVAGKLEVKRVLDSKLKLFEGRRWWLSDLGAMSNDGKRVLAQFGVTAPDGKRMLYRWHTVELASGKILGEGMTIENGKVSPESGVKTK
jgi:hypothetical protein